MTVTTLSNEHFNHIEFRPCPICGKDPFFRKIFTADGTECTIVVKCSSDEKHNVTLEEQFALETVSGMPLATVNAIKRLASRWNVRYK